MVNVICKFLAASYVESDDRIKKLLNRREKPAHRKKEYVEMDDKM